MHSSITSTLPSCKLTTTCPAVICLAVACSGLIRVAFGHWLTRLTIALLCCSFAAGAIWCRFMLGSAAWSAQSSELVLSHRASAVPDSVPSVATNASVAVEAAAAAAAVEEGRPRVAPWWLSAELLVAVSAHVERNSRIWVTKSNDVYYCLRLETHDSSDLEAAAIAPATANA